MGGAPQATPPPQFARLKDESPAGGSNYEDEVEEIDDARPTEADCSLSDWGEWSDCSSECDRGTR
jgi:U3 small nucleolar RNA-associated protein 14